MTTAQPAPAPATNRLSATINPVTRCDEESLALLQHIRCLDAEIRSLFDRLRSLPEYCESCMAAAAESAARLAAQQPRPPVTDEDVAKAMHCRQYGKTDVYKRWEEISDEVKTAWLKDAQGLGEILSRTIAAQQPEPEPEPGEAELDAEAQRLFSIWDAAFVARGSSSIHWETLYGWSKNAWRAVAAALPSSAKLRAEVAELRAKLEGMIDPRAIYDTCHGSKKVSTFNIDGETGEKPCGFCEESGFISLAQLDERFGELRGKVEAAEQEAFVCPECGGTGFIKVSRKSLHDKSWAETLYCKSCEWSGKNPDVRATKERAESDEAPVIPPAEQAAAMLAVSDMSREEVEELRREDAEPDEAARIRAACGPLVKWLEYRLSAKPAKDDQNWSKAWRGRPSVTYGDLRAALAMLKSETK